MREGIIRKSYIAQEKDAVYSIICLCLYIFLFSYFTIKDMSGKDKNPSPFGVDFAVYYTAGQMVTSDNIGNIYNVPVHHAALEKVLNRKTPFLLSYVYPPTFLLAIVPFSYLPYYWALTLWLAITLALAFWSIYILLPKHKNVLFVLLCFPGILMNLRWGQNAFLNTALLGFGLCFVDKTPIVSGLMFGLLSYKPQLAFFPILIFAISKQWRLLSWTLLFSAISSMASGLIFGFDVWINFFHSFLNSSTALLETNWESMAAIQPTCYAAFRLAGLNSYLNYILLTSLGIAVVISTGVTWRKATRLSLRGSALVLGILLTAPYFIQYDLMILGIPLVLLTYDCLEYGFHRFEKVLLLILCTMPLINWPLASLTKIQICPYILIAVLVMTRKRSNLQLSGKTI